MNVSAVFRAGLGIYPTPVERVASLSTHRGTLWVKRDDLTSPVYGGNKVRKLELLLAAARAAGRSKLLTIGAAGSHQVVATAVYGKQQGFRVEAVLVGQPHSPHAEENLRVALAHGLVATVSPAWALAPPLLATRWERDAYFIRLGGSSPLATRGFVAAGRELAAQVRAGELPEPDVIVVAVGSGGTAAGLALGLEEAGLATRILGVAVSPPAPLLLHLARRLVAQTASLEGLSRAVASRAEKRIEITGRWIGKGYGHETEEGRRALATGARAGLTLDGTYTAKAFAAALAEVEAGRSKNVLFWHTLSSAPLPDVPHEPLPPHLRRLFRDAPPFTR
ncbi:MAG: Bifunctional protein: zinc-containing alcohol dehydrogenase [Labilithrix sp.]|nr:Bifunctional protein: zinc-containing alcohol dehydrogenase [Labilithrix sp.]